MTEWTCVDCGYTADDEPPGKITGPFCGLCARCRKCCVKSNCGGTNRAVEMATVTGQKQLGLELKEYLSRN